MEQDTPRATAAARKRVGAKVAEILALTQKRTKGSRSVEQLALELGQFQSRGGDSRTAFYGWLNQPDSLSATTLVAAIEMVGEDALKILLPDPAPDAGEERLRSLEERVDRLEDRGDVKQQ